MTIADLRQALAVAKAAEAEARARRLMLEEQLAEAIPGPDEGTVRADGVKVVRKLTYQVSEEIADAWGALADEERAAIKWKPSLVLSEYRKLRQNSLTQFVTAKPARPAVTIEEE